MARGVLTPPHARLARRFLLSVVAQSALLSGQSGCTVPESHAAREGGTDRGAGIVIDPAEVTLGDLRPGQASSAAVAVTNRRPERIVVTEVESSCPCVTAGPTPLEVVPGGTAALRVSYDPSEAGGFSGNLSVELTAYGSGRERLFATRVKLSVGRPGLSK